MNTATLLTPLRASRERLLAAIAGLTEEGFQARPDTGGWSVAEVLVHVMDCEQQAAAALAANQPPPPASVDSRATLERWQGAPTPQIVHGLLAARRSLEMQLTALSRDDPAHVLPGKEGAGGLATYIRSLAAHELKHVAQIEAVRSATRRQRAPAL